MKVIILCGGMGTRLREETEYRPKPLVPIGGRPILWHIMKYYACYGFNEFILCLGYKGEMIKDYFRNYHWNVSDVTLKLGAKPLVQYHSKHAEEDWTVTLLETGFKTMTAGRLRQALAYVTEPSVMFTYGDGLTGSDLRASLAFHKSHGGLVTLTGVLPQGRYGELGLNGHIVSSFREKPEKETNYINGGFFVMERTILNHLGEVDCMFEAEPLTQLAEAGQVHAYKHNGFWQCMDTYREYELLNELWDKGQAPWKIW
jgi:glucose-1-phosphate cytidylyltransferase